jgi:type VI protein secretion system component VasK
MRIRSEQGAKPMRRISFAVVPLSLLLLAVSVGACSSDSQSAESAVCSDASTFKDSVSKLGTDVTSGNFGDAKDQISTVKSDLDSLESSAKKLASSKKASVQDDLNGVKGTLSDLTSATSLEDIQSTLRKAETQLNNTANSISKTLSC